MSAGVDDAPGAGAPGTAGPTSKVERSLPKAAWNGASSSIGIGITSVEFFSADTSVTVYRYLSW